MSQYYSDYIWKNGIPYGIAKLDDPIGVCYKIPADPYRKRIVIEEYFDNNFKKIIYDSTLLDFRHLKPPAEQIAWQKTVIFESKEKIMSHIRNQDDRLICIESCFFQNDLCLECHVTSPLAILVSIHRMFYLNVNAGFNGVILYDVNDHPVMIKRYEADPETHEFTTLIEEDWSMDKEKVLGLS